MHTYVTYTIIREAPQNRYGAGTGTKIKPFESDRPDGGMDDQNGWMLLDFSSILICENTTNRKKINDIIRLIPHIALDGNRKGERAHSHGRITIDSANPIHGI